jgi:hypothetical protein
MALNHLVFSVLGCVFRATASARMTLYKGSRLYWE